MKYAGEEYTKDSSHFLSKIEDFKKSRKGNTVPKLMAIDVVGLYPNADLTIATSALKSAMREVTDWKSEVINLICELCLLCNEQVIVHQGKGFKISGGIVTGSLFAVPWANIFMSYVKRRIFEKMPTRFLNSLAAYSRFIDDIYSFWCNTTREAGNFKSWLEKAFAEFKLEITFRFDTSEIEFLDVLVYLDENREIQTREFRKETAKCSYLKAGSNHPSHVFHGIVKSQALRLRRIHSVDDEYIKSLGDLKTRCLNSDYPEKLMNPILDVASNYERRIVSAEEYLAVKKKPTVDKILWVCEYTPGKSSIYNELKLLVADINKTVLSRFRTKIQVISTIQSSLARTLFNNPNREKPSSNRCDFKRCQLCPDWPDTINQVITSELGEVYNVATRANCKNGGIYLATCKDCESKYVGKSVNFYQRFLQHTAKSSHSALHNHLRVCTDSSQENVRKKYSFSLIFDMYDRGKYSLSEIEQMWIAKIKASMNVQKSM